MIDTSAIAGLMIGQVIVAAVLALVTGLGLRSVDAGSAAGRHMLAATAFYAAALWPLASVLPQKLTVAYGPEALLLFEAESLRLAEFATTSPWRELCLALALVAAAITFARFAATFASVRAGEKLVADARRVDPKPYGLPTGVLIGASDTIASPLLAGLFTPTILYPAHMRDAPELSTLLHHEYAHLRRGDLRAAFFQRVIEDICWWNWPLKHLGVWLSEQREMACDEYAASADNDYARALASETRRRLEPTPLAVGIDGPSIERRLERLVEPKRRPLALSAALVTLTIFAGIVAAPRLDRNGATYVGINAT